MDEAAAGIISASSTDILGPPSANGLAADALDVEISCLAAAAVQVIAALHAHVVFSGATGTGHMNLSVATCQSTQAPFQSGIGMLPVETYDVAIAFADCADKGISAAGNLVDIAGRIGLTAGHEHGRREEEY